MTSSIQPPEHYYILKGEDGLYSWRATPLNGTHLRESRKAACASASEHRDRIIADATPAIEKKVREEASAAVLEGYDAIRRMTKMMDDMQRDLSAALAEQDEVREFWGGLHSAVITIANLALAQEGALSHDGSFASEVMDTARQALAKYGAIKAHLAKAERAQALSGLDESLPPPGYVVHTFGDGRQDPNVVVHDSGFIPGPPMTLAVAWTVFKRNAAPLVEAAKAELEARFETERAVHAAFAKLTTEQRDRAWATIERLTAQMVELGAVKLKTTEDLRDRYRRNLPIQGLREDFVNGLVDDVDTLTVEVARLRSALEAAKRAP